MKKLILYNHLGVKEAEYDIFIEGADWTHEFLSPTCVWLGKIMLVDKEPEKVAELVSVVEMSRCGKCGGIVPLEELNEYGLCSKCAKAEELKKEVISESEAVGDKSPGESGVSEAEQPESPERQVKKRAGRKVTSRSKRVRDTKTT